MAINTVERVAASATGSLISTQYCHMTKNAFLNPSLLFLVAANIFCIWYYSEHPDGFSTIVWIYWFQSIIIGLFNFLDLLTLKKFDAGTFKINGEPATDKNKGCIAWFFLVHYGAFHFGYAIFLLVQLGISNLNSSVIMLVVAGFFVEGIISFRKQKAIENVNPVSIGALFFLPYLRIVPMHLMILGPLFFGWQASTLFLLLKTGADVLAYLFYQHLYGRQINE